MAERKLKGGLISDYTDGAGQIKKSKSLRNYSLIKRQKSGNSYMVGKKAMHHAKSINNQRKSALSFTKKSRAISVLKKTFSVKAPEARIVNRRDPNEAVLKRTEVARLQAINIATTGKLEGKLKKLGIIAKLFDTALEFLSFSFDTAVIQLKTYETIGDILFIYKDYINALIYYKKGVMKLVIIEIVCGAEEKVFNQGLFLPKDSHLLQRTPFA